jgi:hypothetical protein
MARLGRELPYTRFLRENVGALLQHYGIKTPWLDLVDNLYTATWFAFHQHHIDAEGRTYYTLSDSDVGYLYLVATREEMGHRQLVCVDLRKHHSSLNVRPHAQHGVSAAASSDSNAVTWYDYEENVVARIRLPKKRAFLIGGGLAQVRFLFPGKEVDDSYRILLNSGIGMLLKNVTREYNLDRTALGGISKIRYRAPRVAGIPPTDV